MSPQPTPDVERSPRALTLAVVQTVVGLFLLVLSARLMVDAAQAVASALGVDETIIGATVVAVGTSIPELAASLVAVARRHYDIGIGNIVGSNLMNLTFVLGTVPFIRAIRNTAAEAMTGMNWVNWPETTRSCCARWPITTSICKHWPVNSRTS